MILTKTMSRKEQVVVKKECDCCHKEYEGTDFIEWQEFTHISFIGGYGSIFGDEAPVRCDLCQHCLKKLLGPYLHVGKDWIEQMEDEC